MTTRSSHRAIARNWTRGALLNGTLRIPEQSDLNAAQETHNRARDANVSGSMTATFANGETFTGRYFQITSSLTDGLGPQGPIWHQEGPYDVGPELQNVAHYTGRVAANLSQSEGAQMRCRFKPMRPVHGMAGGARGECQPSDGLSVDAQFPAD
jgi:hypothetical protein